MTNKQKQDLGDYILFHDANQRMADAAIEWIRKNLSPDEVFNKTELLHWCKENESHLENKYPITEY